MICQLETKPFWLFERYSLILKPSFCRTTTYVVTTLLILLPHLILSSLIYFSTPLLGIENFDCLVDIVSLITTGSLSWRWAQQRARDSLLHSILISWFCEAQNPKSERIMSARWMDGIYWCIYLEDIIMDGGQLYGGLLDGKMEDAIPYLGWSKVV